MATINGKESGPPSPLHEGFKWSPSVRKNRVSRVPFKYVFDLQTHKMKSLVPGGSVENNSISRSKRRKVLEVNVVTSSDDVGIDDTCHESCSEPITRSSGPSTWERVLWQPTLCKKRDQSDYSEFDHCLSVYDSITSEIKKQSINNNNDNYYIDKHKCLVIRNTVKFLKKN